MKKTFIALFSLLCMLLMTSCNDYETYGEKKDKERKDIQNFIAKEGIAQITEKQFHAQGDSTSVAKNEYVYLENTGVYMQIVRKGCGEPLKDNENTILLCRFIEMSLRDSTAISNYSYPYNEDKLYVLKNGMTYTASFVEGLMLDTHESSVPKGWIAALPYLNVGRDGRNPEDEIAKVKLIVPHSQGTLTASNYVYAYYYELTFEREQ